MVQFGGCYCGQLKYKISSNPLMKGQCHCRECQYIAGGAPQYFMVIQMDGFEYTSGNAQQYFRTDIEDPVTREFCGRCGTHILTRRLDFDGVLLKVGTLDHPTAFKAPNLAIFTKDMQPFHHIPKEIPQFESKPPE